MDEMMTPALLRQRNMRAGRTVEQDFQWRSCRPWQRLPASL